MKTHSKHAGPKARSVRRLILCALAVPILFLAQAAAPAQTATGPSGLVAAYGFDAGSGTAVADQSGNGNNGTVANTTWAATGKYGKALQFNGTSSLVTIPDAASLHLTSGMTLEAWVDPSTVNGNWRDVIYKGNDNYYLEATSSNASKPDGGLIAGGSYGDAYGTAALPANTWSYLTETYDGATLRLYVNGTQVASTAHTGAISTSTNPLQIGGDSLYGQFFAGMIDEVRIYNTALTATQIQADQTTPVTPGRADVFGWRVGVGVVGDGGVAGQRRRQPVGVRERAVYVRHPAGVGGGLQRDGEDESVRPDVHGGERVGNGRLGQRDQRRG